MFISAAPLVVNDDQKRELEALLRNGSSSQREWRFAPVSCCSQIKVWLTTPLLAIERLAADYFGPAGGVCPTRDGCGHRSSSAEAQGRGAHSGVRAEDPHDDTEN